MSLSLTWSDLIFHASHPINLNLPFCQTDLYAYAHTTTTLLISPLVHPLNPFSHSILPIFNCILPSLTLPSLTLNRKLFATRTSRPGNHQLAAILTRNTLTKNFRLDGL